MFEDKEPKDYTEAIRAAVEARMQNCTVRVDRHETWPFKFEYQITASHGIYHAARKISSYETSLLDEVFDSLMDSVVSSLVMNLGTVMFLRESRI